MDLRHVIERLCAAENLTADETEEALDALIDADPAQISAFLVLMRAKGESAEEMAGMARAMRARAVTVDAGNDVLDIVGTGGDGHHTVNFSTAASVVADSTLLAAALACSSSAIASYAARTCGGAGARCLRLLKATYGQVPSSSSVTHGRWPGPIEFLHRRRRRWQREMST